MVAALLDGHAVQPEEVELPLSGTTPLAVDANGEDLWPGDNVFHMATSVHALQVRQSKDVAPI
jgi:hypothetical protein